MKKSTRIECSQYPSGGGMSDVTDSVYTLEEAVVRATRAFSEFFRAVDRDTNQAVRDKDDQ